MPNVDSFDSHNSENNLENLISKSSESSYSGKDVEDGEEPTDNDNSEATCYIGNDGVKYWTSICEESKKPQLNQHFTTLEEAFCEIYNM